MKKGITIVAACFLFLASQAQSRWSEALSQTAMRIWPDSFLLQGDKGAKWRYDQGVILKGMEQVWRQTGDGQYFRYIQQSMDFYLPETGGIRGYRPDEYNLDHLNNGKLLLLLYKVTGKEKYLKATRLLREQLLTHPRTSEGGFWHKKIYPSQMWLDGLFMAEPFYAEYAALTGEDTVFNDIARQFILMEKHALDPKTGLLYHGWDESRKQQWSNPQTGQSPNFWARSLGWYGMALIDVLEFFPQQHPQRKALLDILNRFVVAVKKVQDPKTGLWYDLPTLPNQKGNYPEASASAMLTYTFAKGARLGYIPSSYAAAATKAYSGIIKAFIETAPDGQVNLKGTVAVSGLGGNPYRDGSVEYYLKEPVVVNDPKGMGAFILCAAEMELQQHLVLSKGKTILLDNFYNQEKKAIAGKETRWHYTWDDQSNGGYRFLGDLFIRFGASIKTLSAAPDAAMLKGASVYVIVDPDIEKENPKPQYIQAAAIKDIADWVKAGGTLVLLGNDTGNVEFAHFNELAGRFGIQFNTDSKNRVQGDRFQDGLVEAGAGNPVFAAGRKLYIKEYSSLSVKTPAKPLLEWKGDIVMAMAAYGKGKVFVLGDPWIYNEYVDGRKLPASFENYPAAEEWVKWILKNAK